MLLRELSEKNKKGHEKKGKNNAERKEERTKIFYCSGDSLSGDDACRNAGDVNAREPGRRKERIYCRI